MIPDITRRAAELLSTPDAIDTRGPIDGVLPVRGPVRKAAPVTTSGITPVGTNGDPLCIALVGSSGAGVSAVADKLAAHRPDIAWLDTSDSTSLAVMPCLLASDGVIVVMSATQGLASHICDLWESVAHLPTTIVVTHLDEPRADLDECAAIVRRVMGFDALIPYLPIHDDTNQLAGFLDVLGDVIHVQELDGAHDLPTDDEHRALTEGYRDDVIDLLVAESADDVVVASLLAGDGVETSRLQSWLQAGIRAARIHVMLGCALDTARGDIGLDVIASSVSHATPAWSDHEAPVLMTLAGDPTTPLDQTGTSVAFVLGNDERGTIVRVLAGTLEAGQDMMAITDGDARPYVVTMVEGGTAFAGDLAHIAPELAAGVTLSDPAYPVTVVSGGPHLG